MLCISISIGDNAYATERMQALMYLVFSVKYKNPSFKRYCTINIHFTQVHIHLNS